MLAERLKLSRMAEKKEKQARYLVITPPFLG